MAPATPSSRKAPTSLQHTQHSGKCPASIAPVSCGIFETDSQQSSSPPVPQAPSCFLGPQARKSGIISASWPLMQHWEQLDSRWSHIPDTVHLGPWPYLGPASYILPSSHPRNTTASRLKPLLSRGLSQYSSRLGCQCFSLTSRSFPNSALSAPSRLGKTQPRTPSHPTASIPLLWRALSWLYWEVMLQVGPRTKMPPGFQPHGQGI